MAEDWFLSRISTVEQAALFASRALASVPEIFAPARTDRLAKVPLTLIARDLGLRAAEQRRLVASAYREYEHSMAVLRADVVRGLVDEEGIQVSQLTAQMGISRQAITRLYRRGRNLNEDLED
jgi:hypothetical protein